MADLTVSAQEDEDGSIHIGVKKDGVFVPIASRAPGSVGSLVESAQQAADAEKEAKKGGGS